MLKATLKWNIQAPKSRAGGFKQTNKYKNKQTNKHRACHPIHAFDQWRDFTLQSTKTGIPHRLLNMQGLRFREAFILVLLGPTGAKTRPVQSSKLNFLYARSHVACCFPTTPEYSPTGCLSINLTLGRLLNFKREETRPLAPKQKLP